MRALVLPSLGLVLVAACVGAAGDAAMILAPETNIVVGFGPSTDDVGMVDGWTVTYDTYALAIEAVELGRNRSTRQRSLVVDRVADLRALPASGATLGVVENLERGRWEEFGYSIRPPTAQSIADATLAQTDVDRMVSERCSLLMRGSLDKTDGHACPGGAAPCVPRSRVAFDLCLPVDVRYERCATEDGLPGVVVPGGGQAVVELSLHGDHAFFTRFPSSHGLVERRAQWFVDADLDGNASLAIDELRAIDEPAELARLFPAALGYDFSGAGALPTGDAAQILTALLSTLGHFQGEGECALRPPH